MKKLIGAEPPKILSGCQKATYLIERQQLEEILLAQASWLKLHLVGCTMCEKYREQSILINKCLRGALQITDVKPELELAFKEALQEQIAAFLEDKKNARLCLSKSFRGPAYSPIAKEKNRNIRNAAQARGREAAISEFSVQESFCTVMPIGDIQI